MGRRRYLKLLPQLMVRDKCRCCRCGHFVVMYRSVMRRRKVAGKSGTHVRWVTPWGRVARARVATVEHRQRREDGGQHELSNLLLYCSSCNCISNNLVMQKRKTRTTCKYCDQKPTNSRSRVCRLHRMGMYMLPMLLGLMPADYMKSQRRPRVGRNNDCGTDREQRRQADPEGMV